MKSEVEQVQEHLLPMLEWFHGKCLSENCTYFAIGGTALGAHRHEGFIPWDDDIDVGLPRPDYNRLLKSMECAGSNYVLETPFSTAEGYVYPFSKLYDTTTTLVESTWHPLKRGVYIDVFPIDGIGNSIPEALRNARGINRKKQILNLRILRLRKGRNPLKNGIVAISHAIPSKVIGDRKLAQELDNECQKRSYDDYLYVGNLLGAYGAKEIVPRVFFGNPELARFEGIEICVPEMIDEYLTAIYGDWQRLPPEDKRVSHHSHLLLDLDSPF